LDAPGCNVLTSFLQSLPCSDPPLPEGIRNLGIDLVLSIGIQGKTLGYIAAGRRLSGGSFTDDDTDLLRAMAEEAFMAAERHRLQESVILEHAAAEKLGELNRLKSGFIAHVSHELRTPLTSIRWSVENLLDGIPEPCSPRVREYLVGIHESSLHLAHMIENLLNSTRIDAARLDLLLENVDVCRAVKAATDVVRPVAEKKQIVLRTSCAEGLALVADAHGVQTILINLVDNAVKYSPGGSAVTVEARQARPGDDLPFCTSGVVLAVKDEGTGIPSDRLGSIFDPFERVRSEKTTGERGLGLGLHIVKQLVTQLGGHITVESTLGIGSTFTVVLPQATPKA
jgi:signal transduction histidine kinase